MKFKITPLEIKCVMNENLEGKDYNYSLKIWDGNKVVEGQLSEKYINKFLNLPVITEEN